MNQNLKCIECDLLLKTTDNVYFVCENCIDQNIGFQNVRICFIKEDLNISRYYHFYIKKNKIKYYLFSDSETRYTYLSIFNRDIYKTILEIKKHLPINGTLPLKNQVDNILDQLLEVAIFI